MLSLWIDGCVTFRELCIAVFDKPCWTQSKCDSEASSTGAR